MPWAKIDDRLTFHPKIVAAGNEAVGAWVRMMSWSRSFHTDGDLPVRIAREIAGNDNNFANLFANRLLDKKDEETVSIHDFLDYNDSDFKKLEISKKRMISGRLGGIAKSRNRLAICQSFAKQNPSKGKGKGKGVIHRDPEIDPNAVDPSNASGAELHAAHAQSPVFLSIPLNSGAEHPVTEADISEWSKLFPAVDVPQELRKIRAWNLSRPRNRKTTKGIHAHITGWLAKEQDRGPKNNPAAFQAPRIFDQGATAAYAAVEEYNARIRAKIA